MPPKQKVVGPNPIGRTIELSQTGSRQQMKVLGANFSQDAGRVSIVLPFYRSGRFLREAINSILDQQGFDNWDLCLVNDGSDDYDVKIAAEFCRLHPAKIQLLHHSGNSHKGTSASRNLAIHNTSGEYVAFLDADDIWCNDKLKRQMKSLSACKTADMIYGAALRWHSWNGGIDVEVPVHVDGYGADCLVPGSAVLATFLRDESQTPCTGSVIIRRSAVEKAGYCEENFTCLYDDQVFYSKLCRFCQILASSDCVSFYRQHPDSCCRQAESQQLGASARSEFLRWLRQYEETYRLASAEPALPSR